MRELDTFHVDFFHIDCNDDPKVFDDIRRIRAWSDTPIDLHIISEHPEQYFAQVQELAVEWVQVQYENLAAPIQFPPSEATKWGLAILPTTNPDILAEYESQLDFALLMTTTPGQSGGRFRKENFQTIRHLRRSYPSLPLHVDGGVNDEVSFILRNLGVRAVVSGSYLVNHSSIGRAMLRLKHQEVSSHYQVKDFMLGLDHLPVITEAELSVPKLLQLIEDYRLGFAMVVGEAGRLSGFCSNADIRRGLLRHLEDFNGLSVTDLVNRQPITVPAESTIAELLQQINGLPHAINYVPVIASDGTLAGALTFHNLIKGEL